MYQLRFSMRTPDEGRSPGEVAVARTAAYQASIEMAAWGEQHGNVGIAISEHHASPDGYIPSPLILASAMAARTQSTIIVVAALLGLLYDPIRLAEDLAVLNHVSSGRVMCVIGMGYRDEEFQMFDVDPRTRAQHMQGSYRIYTSTEAAELSASGQNLSLEPLCGGLPPERAWHYLRTAAAAVAPSV